MPLPNLEDIKTAADARTAAAEAYREAAAITEGKSEGEISAEELASFRGLFDQAAAFDAKHDELAPIAEQFKSARDKLDFYHTAAKGQPVPWASYRTAAGGDPVRALTPGQAFVESDEYRGEKGLQSIAGRLADSDRVPLGQSQPVVVQGKGFKPPEGKAATDVIGGGAGPGGALIIPDYQPGIVPLSQRELTVRQLFSQDTTESDIISYAQQSGFDNAAAAVAEATATAGSGAKPQSSIAWVRKTSPVETIATWMAATRKQLADAGQTRSLIDNQLRLMLQLEEEDQLVNGNGTSPNLRGLLATVGVQTLDLSAGTADYVNLDGIRDAIRMVQVGASRLRADAVLMHPTDSAELDLLKDANDRYYGEGPFGGSAGEGPAPVWRKRRVESEAIAVGTAIVGAFGAGATVFEREGIVILTSDSHQDFFTRNLVAVLGEERLGFAVYFPSAFVVVTLDAWPA